MIREPTESERREWEAEFEAAAKRPLEQRLKYAFIKTYKPVLDDAPYRRMIDYDGLYADVYLVDAASGSRKLVVKQLREGLRGPGFGEGELGNRLRPGAAIEDPGDDPVHALADEDPGG